MAPIEHLGVDVAKETLGVFVCPSGAADKQLDMIKFKAQEWTSRAEDSKLMRMGCLVSCGPSVVATTISWVV